MAISDDGFFIEENPKDVTYVNSGSYLENGSKKNNFSNEETKLACAKKIGKRLYIRMKDGFFMDPFTADYTRQNVRKYRWQKVSSETYDWYLKYLRTGSKNHLNRAIRSLVNNTSSTTKESM